MTKRVKQHQLEDLSRSKYSLAIPSNWVFRDKDKDYGIDAEVEIFDDNNRATGLVYWVQLKATEAKAEATASRVDLRIESIKYHKKLDIPVLIVRYSKVHDRFYSKWAHEIDLFFAKEHAKTLRINFSKDDIWDEKSPIKVKKYLEKIKIIKDGRFKLPIPVSIIVKDSVVNKIPRGILVSSYRTALSKFSDFAVFQSDPEDSLLLVTLGGDELKISLSSISGCTFHSIKKREQKEFAEGLVADSLLGLSIALSQVGQCETMARIVLNKKLKQRFFQKREVLFHLMPYLLGTSYFGAALDAVSDAIAGEEDDMLENITNMAVLFEANPDNEEKSNKIEAFLKKCLEKYLAIGEKTQIGICHYNLGNHYRSRRLDKKAITHYLKARKYEDKYLNQAYYYKELGGVLFHYGKYYFSSSIYKKALDKGASESVKPLYADALMHSGNYQLAFDVFSEYLSSSKEEHEEWHLKTICLQNLINSRGIKKQTRRKKEALNTIDITKAAEENLESAIEMDLLCGLAWFNLGIEQHRQGKHEDAAFSFTICGLVQTWDIEAWVKATVCCFNQKETIPILPLILRTGYFYNGDQFLSKLYKQFKERCDSKILVELTNVIEEVLPKKNKKDRPAIRLMGEDGIFRDVFEEKKPNNALNTDRKNAGCSG